MSKITSITPRFAVAGELTAGDFAEIAQLGFRTVISNRPDGEAPGQLTAAEERALAAAAGLGFRHVPVRKLDVFSDGVVAAMAEALGDRGPVLAHCKSGMRSAIVWAAAEARNGKDIGALLRHLARAGFELEEIREDLEEVQASSQPDPVLTSLMATAGVMV